MKKRIIFTASVFGGLAVIAGAFGAHGLEKVLSPKNLQVWHTAVEYQFYHAGALGILSTLTRYRIKIVPHCYYLFFIGTICFCGSVYLLACEKQIAISWLPAVLGPITPVGGLLLIAGWVTLAIAGSKIKYK
ncbi:MAG TPA: DUF423 domain-containing protein [Mucilaginibacter sp.]|jgi:uncharacterized membrane protein YgdD (TMEM256/DUF423 family)|nr:DUF423 domain-containing protein [Mucilaginibacter sp.]